MLVRYILFYAVTRRYRSRRGGAAVPLAETKSTAPGSGRSLERTDDRLAGADRAGADRASVDRAYAAALENGGACEGPPGPRSQYHAPYCGAYFRNPDGNKIFMCCHDPAPVREAATRRRSALSLRSKPP